jgi:hypothetical protein
MTEDRIMEIISRAEAKRLGITHYFTGNPCKNGHVTRRYVSGKSCIKCAEMKRQKWRIENREHERQYGEIYRQNNPDKIAESKSRYNSKCSSKLRSREYSSNYHRKNRVEINTRKSEWAKANRESRREYKRNYEKENPLYSFTRRSLSRIENAITTDRIDRAELQLGYTQDDFKSHIESLFEPGMSWDNRNEWHIDHIIPISLWLEVGVTDIKVINALDNLQPLWAADNLSKGARIE